MSTDLQSVHSQTQLHDRAIAHLKTLTRKAFLGHAIEVGRYLVNAFFAGDFEALHNKAPDKQANFQAFLAERKDQLAEIDLSPSSLRAYVAAAEVAAALGLLGELRETALEGSAAAGGLGKTIQAKQAAGAAGARTARARMQGALGCGAHL